MLKKWTQTADYCFHHANEQVTTIVPMFSNPKNNSPQSVRSQHFTLPRKLMLEAGNLKWKCFSLLTPELSSILNLILFVIFLFVWNFWEYTFIKWILQSNLHLRPPRLYMIISNILTIIISSCISVEVLSTQEVKRAQKRV